eukprot:Lithocolla_globosa_v1_NODE_1316_length_2676_cov_4.393361.p3 type:complete len:206 gc:universal NODE_1316_length_2676_cov_4.393361:1299-682(-)
MFRRMGKVMMVGDINVDFRRRWTEEYRIVAETWEEWAEEAGVEFLNMERGLGRVDTRIGYGEQRDSMLDYVMATEESSMVLEEMTVEEERIEGTDHRIIGVKVEMGTARRREKKEGKWVWKWREAKNWEEYAEELKPKLKKWRERVDVMATEEGDKQKKMNEMMEEWRGIVMRAAKRTIGKKWVTGRSKAWYSEKVKEAVKKRRE